MKRLFDISLAIVAAPIALVLSLAAAIPIALESRASPFFRQTRLGRAERPFQILKLRTMHPGTPQTASHQVPAGAILRSGSLVRRLKIDELPQLWNVLCGDMSLVGPRPGLPTQAELTEARRTFRVFEMVPGITGISQIDGLDMSDPWMLAESDARYSADWRLHRDLSIILKTVTGAGYGDAAEVL